MDLEKGSIKKMPQQTCLFRTGWPCFSTDDKVLVLPRDRKVHDTEPRTRNVNPFIVTISWVMSKSRGPHSYHQMRANKLR